MVGYSALNGLFDSEIVAIFCNAFCKNSRTAVISVIFHYLNRAIVVVSRQVGKVQETFGSDINTMIAGGFYG